jgi:hypothetical protein
MQLARLMALFLVVPSWLAISAEPANAQPIIAATYAGSYSLLDLGAPPGITGNLGGLTLKAGNPNTLLIGGNANNPTGKIFAIGVVRDTDDHIVGFSGTATAYADAPEIDGDLANRPGGRSGYPGAGGVDASLLCLPLRRVIAADHPRMIATTRRIQNRLGAGRGLLYRYLAHESPDGMPPGEGAFLLCS